MSSYFDVLSWTRARKNKEALEKTNPQNPVLNDDDEEFLQRITSQEAPAPPLPTIEPTVIDDEGNEKEADVTQKEAAEMILPASPGEEKEKRTWASYIPSVGVPSVPSLASLRGSKGNVKPEEKEAPAATEEKNAASEKSPEEPTQDDKNDAADKVEELAETAKEAAQETSDKPTNDSTTTSQPATKEAEVASQEPESEKREEIDGSEQKDEIDDSETKKETDDSEAQTTESKDDKPAETTQRTWASYIPAVPAIPTFGRNTKAHETAEATAKAQSPEAKEQDEREVSVLLDRLNLSAINNRVFSFSDQSQRLYSEFTLILKDIVNGAPTAWEDLETLLKENEKHLEQMFKNMPPFVQTLVKSLPAKFASSMGPEIMAMAGDKPGNDLKKQMEAASTASSSASAANMPNLNLKKKQKRKVPNIKDLASSKGTVTSMLTNIVNFLKVRFPAFVTGTNVVMSLAVFILLFVFWYCHKRGKQVRLLRESESAKASANVSEIDSSSEEDDNEENNDNKINEKQEIAEVKAEEEEAEQSDEEDVKVANAKAYAAAMHRATAVGGPDNAAAMRAKKILES
ncbi:hypothetical protein QM012_007486 [Aureobasidium pullulans]|uniref:Uncharacterized protein n=1 Tax=Aureobasidium pullulans TaxID=5580 RepID=A0ABR0TNN6_AURPU